MSTPPSPAELVQRQLDAFNARDLEAWLTTYSPTARQFEHPDRLLATGHAEIRARSAPRFADPTLHARLLTRATIGNVVIDHEHVSRPNGTGHIELTCIYLIESGLIQTASFIFGPPVQPL